jgi:hypothetical protein
VCNPPICLGKIFRPSGMSPIEPALSAGPHGIVWGRNSGVYLIVILVEPFVDNLNLSLVQSVTNLLMCGCFFLFPAGNILILDMRVFIHTSPTSSVASLSEQSQSVRRFSTFAVPYYYSSYSFTTVKHTPAQPVNFPRVARFPRGPHSTTRERNGDAYSD